MLWVTILLLFVILGFFIYIQERQHLHIYTITNNLNRWELDKLKESVKLHGGKLNVIYTTDKIGRMPIGWGPKIMRLYEAVRDRPPTDIICLVDGFDVLLGAPISEMLAKYKSMHLGDKLLFAAEAGCWPVDPPYESYCSLYKQKGKIQKHKDDNVYLNAGLFMGTVKGFKTVIEERWREIHQHIDDQAFYGVVYLFTDHIRLDHNNEIFQNLIEEKKFMIWDEKAKRWYNTRTKTYPIVLHGNGPQSSRDFLFKTMMPKIMPLSSL
jgi:hypothetical protein